MHPRVAQLLAAIVVLSAAWLMPTLASAHAGHSHHAAAATETTAAPSAVPADTSPTLGVATTTVARSEIARAATITSVDSEAVGGGDGGCATHCCGAAAGMSCCGAAITPEIAIGPALAGSQVLLFERAKAS